MDRTSAPSCPQACGRGGPVTTWPFGHACRQAARLARARGCISRETALLGRRGQVQPTRDHQVGGHADDEHDRRERPGDGVVPARRDERPAGRVLDVLAPAEDGDREEEQGRGDGREPPARRTGRRAAGTRGRSGSRGRRRCPAVGQADRVEHDGRRARLPPTRPRRARGRPELMRPDARDLQAAVAPGAAPADRPPARRSRGTPRPSSWRPVGLGVAPSDEPGHARSATTAATTAAMTRGAPDPQVEAHGRTVRSTSTSSQVATRAAACADPGPPRLGRHLPEGVDRGQRIERGAGHALRA